MAERVAFISLVACTAISPTFMVLQEIAIVIAVGAWGFGKIVRRSAPPRTAANLPLLLWFAAAVLSMVHTPDLSTSLRGLQKIIKVAAIFLTVVDTVRTKRQLSMVLTATAIGAALISVDGLVQVCLGEDFLSRNPPGEAPGGLPRLTATFGHANNYAIYAVSVLPVCLAMALIAKDRTSRWRLWGLIGLLSTSLLFTYSRPAALSLVISLTAFLVIRRAWRTLAGCTAAAALIAISLPAPIKAWVASQPSWFHVLAQPLRFEIWQAALNMIAAHPIVGIGINTFVMSYSRYKVPWDAQAASNAHNHFLQIAAETGLLGLLSFGFLLIRTLGMWQRLLRSTDVWIRTVATGLGCGVLSFLAIGFLESALHSSRNNVFFWLWLGLLFGIGAHIERREYARHPDSHETSTKI